MIALYWVRYIFIGADPHETLGEGARSGSGGQNARGGGAGKP
jgi:hypothetical protein